MKRIKLNRILISILTIIMVTLVFLPDSSEQRKVATTAAPEIDYFMEGIVIHQYNPQGKQINTLQADRMEHSSIYDNATLEKPLITFANERSGKWQLRSNKGKLLKHNSIILLEEKVIIEEFLDPNKIQSKITTRDLRIDLATNLASTKQTVSIQSPYFKTQSSGMEIDFGKEIFHLKNDVNTVIYQ
jgi:LPS export ABC transporter protein LptC